MSAAKHKGWMTLATKDGKQKLDAPFYATNEAYIKAHKEWDWVEVPYEEANNGVDASLQ